MGWQNTTSYFLFRNGGDGRNGAGSTPQNTVSTVASVALYEPDPDDRLFPYTKHYFRKQMQAGCAAAGMEPIRLHDLRHSHAALLINLKYPILLVSQRLGHDNVETTLRTYGHLYPSTTSDMVEKLDSLMP